MKAGCIQFKPEFCNVDGNIKKISQLSSEKDFDLLVLPELSNSGYLFSSFDELEKCSDEIPNGKFCNALAEIAKNKNAFLISGVCEKAGDKYYNSAVLVYPSGDIKTYRKIHLFHEEKKWFTPGDNSLNVYEISVDDSVKVKIGMMICFDWVFPEVSRTLALKGAQIICHPSNLVMPYCQTAMFTRAVENCVFTITANRTGKEVNGGKELSFTGQSVIVDPKGNYLYRGSQNNEECAVVRINPLDALDKNISKLNNIFDDRREELYFK